jgi:hypothetical protein
MSSGNSLCGFAPQDNEPTATDFATYDARNAHPCLDFDASTTEYAVFTGFLPRHYSNGGITFQLTWAGTSGATGSVVWGISIENLGSTSTTNLDTNSFGTATIFATDTCPTTSGLLADTSIAFGATQLDGLATQGGAAFRARLKRNATATGDTMSGDAEMVFLEVRET